MNPFSLDHILSRSTLFFASLAPADALSGQHTHGRLRATEPSGANGRLSRAPLSRSPFPRVVKEQLCVCPRPRSGPHVGLVRVELTTSRLSGVRSNHLSYRPIAEWFPRPALAVHAGKRPLRIPHVSGTCAVYNKGRRVGRADSRWR
jgi:hypothetical protein